MEFLHTYAIIFAIFAFVLITVSLIFAIIILFTALEIRKNDWGLKSDFHQLIDRHMKDNSTNSESLLTALDRIKQMIYPINDYVRFTNLVKWHVISLIGGIILFYLGFLSSLLQYYS
jgi:hypothetical protein